MFGLTEVWGALKRLAQSIHHTADLVDGVNATITERLQIDASIDETPIGMREVLHDNGSGKNRLTPTRGTRGTGGRK